MADGPHNLMQLTPLDQRALLKLEKMLSTFNKSQCELEFINH
jgi:hypothetical protein